MKKNVSEIFRNCTVDGDYLIECNKDVSFEHSISEIFKRWNGVDGVTVVIKRDTQCGEIRGSEE